MNNMKEKSSTETLMKVSGGSGRDFDQERIEEYLKEIMSNDITGVSSLELPHSKKNKWKLFR